MRTRRLVCPLTQTKARLSRSRTEVAFLLARSRAASFSGRSVLHRNDVAEGGLEHRERRRLARALPTNVLLACPRRRVLRSGAARPKQLLGTQPTRDQPRQARDASPVDAQNRFSTAIDAASLRKVQQRVRRSQPLADVKRECK